MAATPAVSVLVTCFEQASWIEEALDSVAAQTFTDWELIVTDDGSTDDSQALILSWAGRHDLPVTLAMAERNQGLTRTLNSALPCCSGRYVPYLGGDDVWSPTKLARTVAALESDPEAAVAYSDARVIDIGGAVGADSFLVSRGDHPGPTGQVFTALLRRNFLVASSAVYQRSALEDAGGWDEHLPFEDWDLLLRLASRHPFVHVPEALVDYRLHDESMIRRRFSDMIEGRLTILEKWLARDPAHDEIILPFVRSQSWRLFKVHPDRGRRHVAVAYRRARDPRGRLRHLVATQAWAESGYEALRRVRRACGAPSDFRPDPPLGPTIG